ncbi:MAG TPA: ATP-binding protein, partial [Erythrobacter sp.]|nr:ATP-binding protein [Erythrobacter sp.]
MRIIEFRAEKVHGYLDYKVKLDRNIVFLTGINGSGKTTIINLIAALISPDLRELQSIDFSSIEVVIEDEKEGKVKIRAIQEDGGVTLSVSGISEKFIYPIFVKSRSVPTYRAEEDESEHFRELLSTSFQNQVIQKISSLPTPMYLGLDRRPKIDEFSRSRAVPRNVIRSRRNLFGGPIHASLIEAREVAETAYRRARAQT